MTAFELSMRLTSESHHHQGSNEKKLSSLSFLWWWPQWYVCLHVDVIESSHITHTYALNKKPSTYPRMIELSINPSIHISIYYLSFYAIFSWLLPIAATDLRNSSTLQIVITIKLARSIPCLFCISGDDLRGLTGCRCEQWSKAVIWLCVPYFWEKGAGAHHSHVAMYNHPSSSLYIPTYSPPHTHTIILTAN